jgi:hypothetical protein
MKSMWGAAVSGLEFDSSKTRVTGVRAVDRREESVYPGDLIVDCSGRGSKTPTWLEANGLEKPATTEIPVNVGYSTRHFRLESAKTPDWTVLLIFGPGAERHADGRGYECGGRRASSHTRRTIP